MHRKMGVIAAIAVYVNDVSSLSQQVDGLLRYFVAENKRNIDLATAHAQQRIGYVT